MEDFEVRQALALIKDRVQDIKKDEQWKQNIAKEWNEANADEAGVAAEDYTNTRRKDDDNKSVISYSKIN